MIKCTVVNQNLSLSYDGVVSDSVKYLKMHFDFSEEWDGYSKTALFRNYDDEEIYSVLLSSGNPLYIDDNTCYVPHEVIKSPGFFVSIFGVYDDSVITADEKVISVTKSGYKRGEIPEDPTPTIYEQILEELARNAIQKTGIALDAVVDVVVNGIYQCVSEYGSEASTINGDDTFRAGFFYKYVGDYRYNMVRVQGYSASVDQTYDPTSENAQSGKAVAEAIAQSVPIKTSDLTNDIGFITKAVNDLTNYYLKSETYTKSEVNNLIGQISSVSFKAVQTLPTQDIQTNVIYLVPKSTAQTKNTYDEYIYVNNAWEKIGDTQIDLSGYATKVSGTIPSGSLAGLDQYGNLTNSGILKTSVLQQRSGADLDSYVGVEANHVYLCTSNFTATHSTIIDETAFKRGWLYVWDGVLLYTVVGREDLSGYATKVSGSIPSGSIAGLDAYGNITNSNLLKTDIVLQHHGSWFDVSTAMAAYISAPDQRVLCISTNVTGTIKAGCYYIPVVDIEYGSYKWIEAGPELVTSLSEQSTDTQYPSAKCMYDIVGDIESALILLRGGNVS